MCNLYSVHNQMLYFNSGTNGSSIYQTAKGFESGDWTTSGNFRTNIRIPFTRSEMVQRWYTVETITSVQFRESAKWHHRAKVSV